MNYDVDYFIKKFEAIPEDNWTTGTLECSGCHCVLGHCGVTEILQSEFGWLATEEAKFLGLLFKDKTGDLIYHINDKTYYKYRQRTPKQRILAALNDVKNNCFFL